MEYTLGLMETLTIAFIKTNDFSTFKYIAWCFMLPLVVFLISKYKIKTRHKYKIVIATLVIMFITDFPIYKSGWKIDEDKFYMKAYFYSDEISISTMEISFIDKNSEWWPSWYNRTGVDLPKLSVGKYSLKKDWKDALLFNHYKQQKLLLISSNNKYYLIGHPDTDSLYNELLRLGAKEKNF